MTTETDRAVAQRLRRAEQRLARLERQVRNLKHARVEVEAAARRWRDRATALGWVYCSGSCRQRSLPDPLTEDFVQLAETNAQRLRAKFVGARWQVERGYARQGTQPTEAAQETGE